MDLRDQLARHLDFMSELGVMGISRDPRWSTRSVESTVEPSESPSLEAPAGGPVALVRSSDVLAGVRTDIGDCTRCKLHKAGRHTVVFGVGNPEADLMFVGEAPGRDEDLQGEPFVGRAGQKLTQIIEAIGLKRDQVYIANVIKCRPPENRNPEPDEVDENGDEDDDER